MASSVCREPVKVVIINTQYVETDARSFKSVVQKLTGKDSNVADWNGNSSVLVKNKKEEATTARHELTREGNSSVFMRDMSFKELDTLLREMSSVDELLKIE